MTTRIWIACFGIIVCSAQAATNWTDFTAALLTHVTNSGAKLAWPGGCAGVVVNRTNGDVTVKVVGHGLWRTSDQGKTWQRLDGDTVSGRDETGWATSNDQNAPTRLASFSLDGKAGMTADGQRWDSFKSLGRNWDYGSVDWSAPQPKTIIAARHETSPPGEVHVSTDGGNSWKLLDVRVQEGRGRVSMVGALAADALIYSNGDGIHRSTDNGSTWTRVSPLNPQTRIPVWFAGAHYLGGTNGLIVSTDKGVTWRTQGAAVNIWQGPYFGRNEREMVVVGKSGIFATTDAGANWKQVAPLKPREGGFLFTHDWFGCYAWDPIRNIIYASSMGNPVFKLQL